MQNPDRPDWPKGAGEAAPPPPLSVETEILVLLPQLRRYSRSLTRSDADGEDLLQDCVEKALARQGQWRGTNFKAWAYRIMTNLHINARRAIARRPLATIEEAERLPGPESARDPLEDRRLATALETLAPEFRAVLMLVVVEGYSYQDVATMLDIPIGTVMSRLSRARHALREKMRDMNVIPMRRPL